MSELKPCPYTDSEVARKLRTFAAVIETPGLAPLIMWAADIIDRRAQPDITGETSDGYHTFNELYHHRAVLFSVICNAHSDIAWKSRQHHDGTMYDGMFIVGINTPEGQATYHYDIEPYWEMFCVRALPKAPEWDGHTPTQAIERIGKLSAQPDNAPLTCEGCVDKGQYENEVGYGYPSPCTRCRRRSPDNYRRKPDNAPLALEELREELHSDPKGWLWLESLDVGVDSCYQRNDITSKWANITAYGKTWFAYRRKPEPEGGEG